MNYFLACWFASFAFTAVAIFIFDFLAWPLMSYLSAGVGILTILFYAVKLFNQEPEVSKFDYN